MSSRYWIIAVVFGLAASLGQAQEPSDNSEGQTTQNQQPTQSLPLPVPVEIIEDQAAADARKSNEAEARQREIDDLAAQEGMNAATQAMKETTNRMAYDSRQMAIATWVGVGLLTVTLLLTLQANSAARAAVDITGKVGRAQTRPYLGAKTADVSVTDKGVTCIVSIENAGQSFANNVIFNTGCLAEPSFDEALLASSERDFFAGSIMPGASMQSNLGLPVGGDPETTLTMSQLQDIRDGSLPFWVFGVISYDDEFGDSHKTRYRMRLERKDGDWLLAHTKEGNEAT